MNLWWLQKKPFNWALYRFLRMQGYSRTYCYYEALDNKDRAMRFFKRCAARPVMTAHGDQYECAECGQGDHPTSECPNVHTDIPDGETLGSNGTWLEREEGVDYFEYEGHRFAWPDNGPITCVD